MSEAELLWHVPPGANAGHYRKVPIVWRPRVVAWAVRRAWSLPAPPALPTIVFELVPGRRR